MNFSCFGLFLRYVDWISVSELCYATPGLNTVRYTPLRTVAHILAFVTHIPLPLPFGLRLLVVN